MKDTPNLFGLPAPKRARKAPALPDGVVHQLIMLWVGLFAARFGAKPVLTPADAAALKRLAREQGADVVARRLPQYLALEDAYVAGEGYPLSLLPRAWNKLVVQDAAPASRVPGPAATAAYLKSIKGGRP